MKNNKRQIPRFKKYGIVCENLNIAGIQRLTLDQAYFLSDIGLKPVIFVRMPENKKKITFKSIEQSLISEKLEIIYLRTSHFRNFFLLYHFFRKSKLEILISHSMKGTVQFRFFKIFFNQEYRIISTLHNYLSLTQKFNQIKIILYSQLSNNLLSYSKSVIQDWEKLVNSFTFFKHLIRKHPTLCRNGVYLPRLIPLEQNKFSSPRLIFIGRLIDWKGFGVLPRIMQYDIFLNYSLIILTQDKELPSFVTHSDRQTIINSETVTSFKFFPSDIHCYPVKYDSKSELKEGVGMNVLEMAAIGVTSLISLRGDISWPELTRFNVVRTVDFDDVGDVTRAIKTTCPLTELEISSIREVVDIKNNLRFILSLADIYI